MCVECVFNIIVVCVDFVHATQYRGQSGHYMPKNNNIFHGKSFFSVPGLYLGIDFFYYDSIAITISL